MVSGLHYRLSHNQSSVNLPPYPFRFVLSDSCLYYFDQTGDKEPRGIIPLQNVGVRRVEAASRPFMFEVCHPFNATFCFCSRFSIHFLFFLFNPLSFQLWTSPVIRICFLLLNPKHVHKLILRFFLYFIKQVEFDQLNLTFFTFLSDIFYSQDLSRNSLSLDILAIRGWSNKSV